MTLRSGGVKGFTSRSLPLPKRGPGGDNPRGLSICDTEEKRNGDAGYAKSEVAPLGAVGGTRSVVPIFESVSYESVIAAHPCA